MSGIRNAWALVTSLRWEDQAHLASWHLWTVLIVLCLLAGFGAHYLVGYGLRFYFRGGRFQWWIAIMALPLLTFSIVALIWSYVLVTGAPRLMDRVLDGKPDGEVALDAEIGAYLLGPAFDRVRGGPPPGPTRDQLAQALAAIPQDQLRTALTPKEPGPVESAGQRLQEQEQREAQPPPSSTGNETQNEPPAAGTPTPAPEAAMAEENAGPAPAILAIVQDWITDPDQTWPEPVAEAGQEDGEQAAPEASSTPKPGSPLSPSEYILSLIGEVPGDAALSESDWAYVAGSRFEERLLRPMLLEYFHMGAIGVVVIVILLNGITFWWINRINRPPAPAKAKPAAAAAPPQPADPLQREVKAP